MNDITLVYYFLRLKEQTICMRMCLTLAIGDKKINIVIGVK